MPLHDFQVYAPDGTAVEGAVIEKFFKPGHEIPKRIELKDGHWGIRLVSLPAKTAGLWHGGWTSGLDNCGVYSTALGRQVPNKHEEAKIMRAKGFIPESDLGQHFVADTQEKLANKWDAQEKLATAYQENLKTMSKEDAIANTFTAENCLNGTYDSVYKQEITK